MNTGFDYSGDSYHRLRHGEFLGSEELCRAWGDFADAAYFESVKSGDEVLEFGGGLALNLLSVSKRTSTWMIEPAAIGRQNGEKHGIRSLVSLAELPPDQKFDMVLCRHVLEHVSDPLSTLKNLREVLKPDGSLVLVLPIEDVDTKPLPVEKDIDHHLFCWNPRTIANLLRVAGFEVCSIRKEFFNGRRLLLPVWRKLGPKTYIQALRLLGHIRRTGELVGNAHVAPIC